MFVDSHALTDIPERALEGGGARQWTVKLDALRRAHGLDPHDRGGVLHHLAQAARGVGGHRHVILLIRGCRQTVHAVRRGQRLVVGGERRRGYVRDHESGVQASVADQERRQSAEIGVDQERDAALR